MGTTMGTAPGGHDHDESKRIATRSGEALLDVFEDGVPPRFRLRAETGPALAALGRSPSRPCGRMARDRSSPSPIAAASGIDRRNSGAARLHRATCTIGGEHHPVVFEEHEHAHGAAHATTTCAPP